MAEQPLATEASAQEEVNELKRITAVLSASNLTHEEAVKQYLDLCK